MNDDLNIFYLYLEAASSEEPIMQVRSNGDKMWYLRGKLHRKHAPAIEYADGNKSWWQHGKLHREDGPAIEISNGHKSWYINNKLHREDGPAVEWVNGHKAWYLNGKKFSKPEKWAANVLVMHGKPHDDESVDEFLKQILKKDIEEAL